MLPLESNVKLLREFCIKEIHQILSLDTFLINAYIYLGKLIYVRLLAFKARTGCEPVKLTVRNWKIVENDRWKRKEDIK